MKIKRPTSRQPLPPSAQKVFKGIMFDVYHWEQKMFDGGHKTFEKIKRLDTVNVIPITPEGKIILCEQNQPGSTPFIGALGGAVEGGEDPLETAERELLEETGMKAQEYVLWDAVQFIDKIDWAIYTFIAKNCTKVKNATLDSGEKIKLVSFTFNEFLDVVAREDYRDSEITIKIFRATKDSKKLEDTRKLFIE